MASESLLSGSEVKRELRETLRFFFDRYDTSKDGFIDERCARGHASGSSLIIFQIEHSIGWSGHWGFECFHCSQTCGLVLVRPALPRACVCGLLCFCTTLYLIAL